MTVSDEKQAVPSVWLHSTISVIYTLTPTHCGIGQTVASVDLPIARDVVTGFPVIPATSLKGVAREYFEKRFEMEERAKELIRAMFGPDLDGRDELERSSQPLSAAGLAFTEGRLAAYPARSLNRPFVHVTCPLIMEKLAQDSRLLGQNGLARPEVSWQSDRVYVADKEMSEKALVIEDLCYAEEEVVFQQEVSAFARNLADMLPDSEKDASARLASGLVVLPDNEFQDLLRRTIPVAARTKLTRGKTTDKWENPETGNVETGSLWYEEYLPSDCLFVSFIGQRRQVYMQNDADSAQPKSPIDAIEEFRNVWKDVAAIQIGGNETIGNGLCLWHLPAGNGGVR